MTTETNNTVLEPQASPVVHGRMILTAGDVTRAYQLHSRAKLTSRTMVVALGICLTILAVFLIATLDDWEAIAVGLVGGLIGGLLVPRVIIRWVLPISARRIFAQQRNLQQPIAVVCDARGLHTTTETATGVTPWPNYMHLREDEHILLLYHSDALFQIVAKRFFTAADVATMHDLYRAARAP
ncbi:YcxB family protein [Lichenihabitans psoromatis]|uniref:YcxB family protein n=1 Tax=Lichenihabitans psoromatis TaxID=2528642 RepID=UPI0010383A57|nr:YcxB family protein [Lichenihabitans psoromatis]